METFYFGSDSIQDINDSRRHYGPDYVIGMVRHVRGIPIDINNEILTKAEEAAGNTENLFCEYFDSQYDLVRNTHPEVVGKFDLIYTFRKDYELTEIIWEKIDRNIRYIAEYGGLFEINAKALTTDLDDPYPQRHVLRVNTMTLLSLAIVNLILVRSPIIFTVIFLISKNGNKVNRN